MFLKFSKFHDEHAHSLKASDAVEVDSELFVVTRWSPRLSLCPSYT